MAERLSVERHMQALFESAPNGVGAINPSGRLTLANGQLARMFGYTSQDLIGRPVLRLFPKHQHAAFAKLQDDLKGNAGGPTKAEFSGLRSDGGDVPVEITLSAFQRGSPGTLLMIVVDATERKRAEERQHLLIGELHHRTQNLFAVIQAVANRSLAGDRSLEEARHVFLARLHALARTYTTLTEGAWQGAELDKILRDELAPFSTRADVAGDPVWIQPSAAQTFALIFHELATNAVKHGALSVPGGQLTVRWSATENGEDSLFTFHWRESGGPRIGRPNRRGYGQTILEDGARHIGTPQMTHAPDGLRYDLTAPLKSIGWTLANLPTPAAFFRPRRTNSVD